MFLDDISIDECYRPLTLKADESLTGPRLGGCPPKGVSGHAVGSRYLLTLPIDQLSGREVSVFMSTEYDLLDYRWDVYTETDPILRIVVHERSERDESRASEAILSPCCIQIGDKAEDIMHIQSRDEPGLTDLYSGHKIGGRAFLIQKRSRLIEQLRYLETEVEARQLIQLDSPGFKGRVSGSWPFADGMFHLYIQQNGSDYHWHYFLQS